MLLKNIWQVLCKNQIAALALTIIPLRALAQKLNFIHEKYCI